MVKRVSKAVLKKRLKRELKKEAKEKKRLLVKDMFERDKGVCVFCNKKVSEKHYQTCHIIPEEFEELRYDINNVLLGCFYHHKVGKYSIHKNPMWFCDWLQKNRPEQYKYLINWMEKHEKC